MNRPKVSVIIPTYNRAHYLEMAIQSVLHQTFPDFELIVADDGSTDDTQSLVQSLPDSRLHYVYQEHKGISAAMNTGLRAARGDFIGRLDSDDSWLPDMLEVEVAILDARPEIGLVYGRAQGTDKEGTLLPEIRGFPEWYPGDSLRSMLIVDFTSSITTLVRRSCFDRVGFYDESLNINEDWDIVLRIAAHYQFAFVDRVVARFRHHDSNSSAPCSPLFLEHLDGRVKVLDNFFSQSRLSSDVLALKPMAYRNLYMLVGRHWLGLQEHKRALRSFLCAVRFGGNPPFTLAQIVRIVLVDKFFSRYAWGRRFAEGLDVLGRRLRGMRT